MPNHVTNHLQASAEILKAIRGEKDILVDFSKTVPMPEGLSIDHNMGAESAVNIIFGIKPSENQLISKLEMSNRVRSVVEFQKAFTDEESFRNLIKALENQYKYGCMSWYDWAPENWGTKWNAYDFDAKRSDENNVFFDTAWNAPLKWFQELAKRFPNEIFSLSWADEDSGANCGVATAHHGVVDVTKYINYSTAAWETYIFLKQPSAPEDEEEIQFYKDNGMTEELLDKIRKQA